MRRIALFAATFVIVLLMIGGSCGKKVPTIPIKPIGAAQTFQGVEEAYRTMSTDPSGKGIRYIFDWGDGVIDTTASPAPSGETTASTHAWAAEGSYSIKAFAVTEDNRVSTAWSDPTSVTVGANTKPNAPSVPMGSLMGVPKQKLGIYSMTTDPEGDSVYIRFHRDTTKPTSYSPWYGPVPGGTPVWDTVKYTEVGQYAVAAYAKDTKGAVSDRSPIATIDISERGIGWVDSSDNASTFSFPPAIYVGADSTIWVYAAADGDSIFLFRDDGGDRPRQSRGDFNHGDGVCEDGPVLSSDNQRVYVPVDDGRMYLLSNTLGEISSWAPDTSRRVFTMPAVNGITLYAGRGDSLYAFTDNQSTFSPGWAFYARSEIIFPPVVTAAGNIVLGTDSTGIYSVSASGGEMWNMRLPASINAAPAIGADGKIFIGCDNGRLYGLDPSTGDSVFTSSDSGSSAVGSAIAGSPIIGPDNVIYVCREEGSVAAYANGGLNTPWTWIKVLPNSTFYSGACLAPDTTIVVHTEEDWLYALWTGTGEIRWPFKLPTATKAGGRKASGIGSAPVIGPYHSRIYVGSAGDRYFFAVTIGEDAYPAGMPASPWPKFQHDVRNSGFASGYRLY